MAGVLRRVRCRERGRSTTVAIAIVLLNLAAVASAADSHPRPLAGLSLTEALAELERQGLAVVYSSALVTPDMVVAAEPQAREPRAALEEILAPHGLALREGPAGQLVVVRARADERSPRIGTISGRVEIEGDIALLDGLTVRVVGSDLEARVGADGTFVLEAVPEGEVSLEAVSSAVTPQRLDGVRVVPGAATRVRLRLAPGSAFLSEIVVTPSHFRILEERPEVRQFLSREEVDLMPHLADDLYRAVKRLPGAAGGDYSATFNVRGGSADEVLVLLDGLELYEPFHLKDFQNAFSTVDAAAVGGVDFLTGGFPVEYGDRMSGVMDIAVATPSGPASTTIGVGTLNARLLSQGGYDQGRGSWLVSARAWYPDEAIEATGAVAEEILTDYYDVLAKLEHRLGSRSSLAADLLVATDDLGVSTADEEETEDVTARYRSLHLWFNLKTDWSPSLFSQSVLAAGRVDRERLGQVVDVVEGTLDVDDQRRFDFLGLKQDWTLAVDDRHLLKWGFDVERQEADYDYLRREVVPDGDEPPVVSETVVDVAPAGDSYGAYVADRLRLSEDLVAELGLRWDAQSWLDDEQISPRLNLRWAVGRWTTARAGWGRFHQSQRLNELQVEDGVTTFYPAQLAQHWLLSLEHRFRSSLALRVEAYQKVFDDLHPRYENLFNPLEMLPEAQADRVEVTAAKGRVQGLELLLRQDGGERVTWWLGYALGRAEDALDGEWVPRSWDQLHAASGGLNLRLPRRWNVSLTGAYHSGWPTTDVTGTVVAWDGDEPEVELVWGPRNRERYPYFLRFDVRATKEWQLRFGELTLIVEVINLTNRSNVCCVEDLVPVVGDDGSVEVIREERSWVPIVPSVGVRWTH